MPAILHLVRGPAGAGKTLHLLTALRAAMGGALWLGPTRRAVQAVREKLARDGADSPRTHVLTFDEFAVAVIRANDPDARPLSECQRRLLLEDVIAEAHRRGELAHFQQVFETHGFAEGVAELIVELKRAGVEPDRFACSDADEKVISRKHEQLARLYTRVEEVTNQHCLLDLEGRLQRARDLLRGGGRLPFEAVRSVFVDGFAELTPVQGGIVAEFCRRLEHVWIALSDEDSDERGELFAVARAAGADISEFNRHVETVELCASTNRPAGLAHLERQLFRPLRRIEQAKDATGLLLLEAPGMVGEARMAARQIKELLCSGVAADEILVSMRDVTPYADLLREVFDEYGIPVDVEGTDSLQRDPAVSMLLRAARLADEDWPFASVTALLRSGFFQPDWTEARSAPDMALQAESLLRLVGESRGRDNRLAQVATWAEAPEPGLEDEEAEESRRRHKHELAKVCRRFLERFFQAWDKTPEKGAPAEHSAWLRAFADDLGIPRAAADSRALARFWQELDHWRELQKLCHGGERALDRRTFLRRLATLSSVAGVARTPRGPGRVRVLSAPLARHLETEYIFVLGLGERSFPRLLAPAPILDEAERQSLRRSGIRLICMSDLLADEMLLFYHIVTRARRQLVLSYPAVDEKGQPLLPGSFLNGVLDCFAERAIPTKRRAMLIEGYDRDMPLSRAELRVRAACEVNEGRGSFAALPADLADNLTAAAAMYRLRFDVREFNAYDGLFRDAAVIDKVRERFPSERVFSPTALEDYVACPFRFFLRHVLRLEPLDEPSAEIEVTRRGQAFHRALSRLHRQLKDAGTHTPSEETGPALAARLGEAIEEYIRRTPSRAAQVLWRLEAERLNRSAMRYGAHWAKFMQPWVDRRITPQPHSFEVDFGMGTVGDPLVIRAADIEIRIGGRIDRVDVAELEDGIGFWIIDYKTGRAANYTSSQLAEFRRLQLTLYALAVEELALAGRGARPLGLAYWLVTDTGPKVVLPVKNQLAWFEETAQWSAVREQLVERIILLAAGIRGGAFPLQPLDEDCTKTCDYSQICRIAVSRGVKNAWQLSLPLVR